jgi:PHD/YefM family antitoxin component YafN of YafNO toxin-antitoxin module
METTTITDARSELYKLAENCIKYNNRTSITTKNGNVILMSEDDYNSLIESLYLAGIPGVYEDIQEGIKTLESEMTEWKKIKK